MKIFICYITTPLEKNFLSKKNPNSKIKDKKADEQPAAPVEEKIEVDKWGDPIKKPKVYRPLSLWAQRLRFEFTVHLHDLTVIEGRNARMICGVTGGKTIEHVWYRNGRKLRFNEKEPRLANCSYDGRTAGIGIELVEERDAGEYKVVFTEKETGEELVTSCKMMVVPKLKKTKHAAECIPPAFVRKLQCEFM